MFISALCTVSSQWEFRDEPDTFFFILLTNEGDKYEIN